MTERGEKMEGHVRWVSLGMKKMRRGWLNKEEMGEKSESDGKRNEKEESIKERVERAGMK